MSKILIVDSEPEIRSLLSETLADAGYEASAVGSIAEALASVSTARVDLVLADMQLPDGDGFALLRELNRLCPEVMVILMSTFCSNTKSVEAIRRGAYDFIEKPLETNRVLVAVKNALETRELRSRLKALKGNDA